MSPAANLVLEEVPFAILELVKARILANRRRRQQAKPKPSTRPGAQFRKVGASTKEWRKPQYGAGVFGRENVAVVLWEEIENYIDDYQITSRTVTIRNATNTASVTFEVNYPDLGLSPLFPDMAPCGGDTPLNVACYDEELSDFYDGNYHKLTQRWQMYGTWQKDIDRFCFALPVSGQNCVIIYGIRHNESGYYGKFASETNLNPPGPVTLTISQKGALSTPELKELKCFLVSNSAIRELDTPTGLQAAIETLREAFTERGTQQQVVDVPGYFNLVNLSFLVPDANTYDRSYVVGGIETALSGISLLTHYGIGALATDWHSSMGAATFYSPAVFTFLNGISPAILDDYADNIQYAYIKSTYLSSAPTPNKFLAPCVLSGSCPYDPATNTDSIGFDRTFIQPSNIETAMAPSDFSASGIRAPVVGRGVDEQIIYAYDWNQPAYCRQQLLALGFTAADLTP